MQLLDDYAIRLGLIINEATTGRPSPRLITCVSVLVDVAEKVDDCAEMRLNADEALRCLKKRFVLRFLSANANNLMQISNNMRLSQATNELRSATSDESGRADACTLPPTPLRHRRFRTRRRQVARWCSSDSLSAAPQHDERVTFAVLCNV